MKLNFCITITLVLGTTGCAQVALYHDRQDMCQGQYASPERKAELGRPADYKNPDYCRYGGFQNRLKVTNAGGQTIGYITK